MIRSIFLGTPLAAIPALGVIHRVTDLRLVVTQPDRPRGRSGRPRPSAVKEEALRLSVPVLQPRSRQELVNGVGEARPFDVGVLVAFGRIVPVSALRLANKGFLNLHFSLLPRWRGAAPIQHSILAGEGSTGVTIIEMDAGLDTGPVLASSVQVIAPEDTSGSLEEKLAFRGAQLLVDLLPDYVEGRVRPRAQDDAQATYAPKIEPAEAGLDFREPAGALARRVRAFNPRP
ncbi:MAG TPA: methionyl-tRNA formyltransferase, partial [Acidimicrobiia bacterium]